MKKYQVGDLVWVHDSWRADHPLLVLEIIGNHDHIKVMSMRNNKHVWFYPPSSLHPHPKGAKQ